MQLLTIDFDDRHVAKQVLEQVELTIDQAGMHLTDLALADSSDGRRPPVRQTSLAGSGPGLNEGGLLGLLAALVVPVGSPPATTVGGALGGVIAAVGDDSVDNPMMRSLASSLENDGRVLLALGDRAALAGLDHVVSPHADDMRCCDVPPATQRLIAELSKLSMEDLEIGWGGSPRGDPCPSVPVSDEPSGTVAAPCGEAMPLTGLGPAPVESGSR